MSRIRKPPGPPRPRRVCNLPYRSTGGTRIPGLTATTIEFESPIERLALATLALCHDVAALESQPAATYAVDGQTLTYHPDFAVQLASGIRVLIEVKSLAHLVRDKTLARFLPITRRFLAEHQPFVFLTDAQLEVQPRFDSVKLLARYLTGSLPEPLLRQALARLEQGPRAIADLLCPDSELTLAAVYTLLAQRHLCFDWGHALNPQTLISRPHAPYEGLHAANLFDSSRYGPLLAELAVGRRPADQSVLAAAAAWRCRRRVAGPMQFVGGFAGRAPIRDLAVAESLPRAAGRRRDHAPGGPVPGGDPPH